MSTNAVADKKSVAARLVGMAQERYVLGVSEDGEPFGADRTRAHLSMLLLTSLLRRHAPALRNLGWAIENDGARNHRNVLLWTVYPPHKDVAAKMPRSPRIPRCYGPAPPQSPRLRTQRFTPPMSAATISPRSSPGFDELSVLAGSIRTGREGASQ